MRLVECVPNFSEGRDQAVVDAITAVVGDADGAHLLDSGRDLDPDGLRIGQGQRGSVDRPVSG